jgi:hypothetical protein
MRGKKKYKERDGRKLFASEPGADGGTQLE